MAPGATTMREQEGGGSGENFQTTHHDIERALEAIAEEDKRAFFRALERAPELIELETHPIKFLLREDFNVARAIQRLALHWKYRVQFFGEERAFRPMTISGDGALSPEDVKAVETGAIMILSGPVPTIWLDWRIIFVLSPDMRNKLNFYHMHVLSEVRNRWFSCKSIMYRIALVGSWTLFVFQRSNTLFPVSTLKPPRQVSMPLAFSTGNSTQ